MNTLLLYTSNLVGLVVFLSKTSSQPFHSELLLQTNDNTMWFQLAVYLYHNVVGNIACIAGVSVRHFAF